MRPEELRPTAAALEDDDGRSAFQPGARLARSYAVLRSAGWPYTRQVRRARRSHQQHNRHRPRQRRRKAEQMRLWDNRPGQGRDLTQVKVLLENAGWEYRIENCQERGASNAAYRVFTLRCRPHAGDPWRYPETLEEIKQWTEE